jgi:hypothetical protein
MLGNGTALIVYGITRRDIPLSALASTWLPIGLSFLVVFVVLFGAGLAMAEGGDNLIGGILLLAGYFALPARSMLRLLAGFWNKIQPIDF